MSPRDDKGEAVDSTRHFGAQAQTARALYAGGGRSCPGGRDAAGGGWIATSLRSSQ